MTPRAVLVIGAGNADRRDDGAGLAVARRLPRLPAEVRVLMQDGDFASLLDQWDEAHLVIIIDATMSGASPGTIRRYDAHRGPLPVVFSGFSTHALGIGDAIELARVLRRLPPQLVVFGIEGDDFTAGEGLSPAVDAAVDDVVALVSTAARSASDFLRRRSRPDFLT
jgi:hydrogenase maturation protease